MPGIEPWVLTRIPSQRTLQIAADICVLTSRSDNTIQIALNRIKKNLHLM